MRRTGALLVGLAVIAASCGDDEKDAAAPAATEAPATQAPAPTEAPATEAPAPTEAPATEAPATEAPATDAPAASGGDLAGFKGTTPLTPLGDDFKARLLEVDPALTDYNYAAEAYDLTVVIALAVEKAQDDGIAYASEIQGITRDGEKCTDFAACKAIIDAGGDPDYDGFSGPITLNGYGDPMEASYGVLTMGEDNRIDDSKTVYLPAKGAADADAPASVDPVEGDRKGDGVLKIGSILPVTGSLAFLGPPEIAGLDLAIKDINEAGGVLGKPVEVSKGDSGDTPEFANQTVDRLLGENVDAIVGAAASGVSLGVIDKITGAGIVQFSPANTSDKLTAYADKGLYFRVAPPDLLQGAAIAKLVADDGATNVAIIARNDAYGTGLADVVEKTLTAAGITVSVVKIYEPDAGTFDAEVGEIKAASPDSVVVIGFEESSKILRTMVENGIGPRDIAVYGCDGNIGNGLGESYDAGK
jgi:ABC-type branched-subunit amino acid transport system substrate-binding protein